MKRPAGKLICLTGIDGSGKTTQAELLVSGLARAGFESQYIWGRGEPVWRQSLIRWGRRVLDYRPDRTDGVADSHEKYQHRKRSMLKSPPLRLLWFLASKFEQIWQLRRDVLPVLRSGRIAVCDRYLYDSTIDMAVAFSQDAAWMRGPLNRLSYALVPRPMIMMLLELPLEEVLRRKDDIPDREYVELRLPLYKSLRAFPDVVPIDAAQSLEKVSGDILREALLCLDGGVSGRSSS